MNRIEYLSALDQSLKGLPDQERREAVEFYYAYFDDGLESGKTEEQIIDELGPITKVAAKIIAQSQFETKNAASQEAFSKAQGGNSIFSGVRGVFLAIGAVVVGLPGAVMIGIPVLGVLLGLLAAAFGILLGFGIVMIVVPIALIVAAVACFASVPVTGITGIGFGLMILGASLLLGTLLYLAAYGIIQGISMLASAIMRAFSNRRSRKAAQQ